MSAKSLRPAFENLERRDLMAADVFGAYASEASSGGSDSAELNPSLVQTAKPATIYLDFGFGYEDDSLSELPPVEYLYGNTPFDGADRRDAYNDYFYYDIKSLAHWISEYSIDYNQDGALNGKDATLLADDVLALVRRTYEPFNVNVEIANVSSWEDIGAIMTSSDSNDTLVIMGGVTGGGFLGVANLPDVTDRANNRDDVVYVTAKSSTPSWSTLGAVTSGSDDVYRYATALARVAAHEAGHSLGLNHIFGGGGLEASDLMDPYGLDKLYDFNQITRGFAFNSYGLVPQDGYEHLASTVGLRPGGPEFVTGTGLHDVITLTPSGASGALVTIQVFEDAAHTKLYAQRQYTVVTTNGILVEAGRGDDIVDASALNVDVMLRGGRGNDLLKGGWGDDVLEGEAGDDVLYAGHGNDTYKFGRGEREQGVDQIVEPTYASYATGVDVLDFSEFRTGISVDLQMTSTIYGASTQTVANDVFARLGLRIGAAGGFGATFENVIGTAFDDEIWGNSLANVLEGRGGADKLYGRNGVDQLFGGHGRDYLDGGADSFVDQLWGGADRDQFAVYSNRAPDSIFDFLGRYDSTILLRG